MDGVFDEEATNSQIFEEAIEPLVYNVLNGINCTVFAYGITGAGKSYTMFGKTAIMDTRSIMKTSQSISLSRLALFLALSIT